MRILHITPYYFPAFKYGGPAISIHIMNKALIKKGIKIDVMTTNANLGNRNDLITNEWIELEGIRIKYFPYYFKDNYTFSPQMFLAILKEIKNYDVVHITMLWHFQALAGSIGSLLYKKPYIICPAGALSEESINLKSRHIKTLYLNLIAKNYLTKASILLYNSEDEKKDANNLFKFQNKSVVIPCGVNLGEYKQLPAKGAFKNKYPILRDKKYILFLSRIHRKKGLDILIDAFRMLVKEDNDLFLVIAGPDNDNYKREVQNKLKENSLLEKTLFPGVLSGIDKLSAYADASVYVLSSYSENFALTVIEALACGTPVVISNKVGIWEIIEKNNAGVVVDLNPKNIYKGITKLLDNPNLGEQIVRNGRKLIEEKYDIDIVANMMIDTYRKLLIALPQVN